MVSLSYRLVFSFSAHMIHLPIQRHRGVHSALNAYWCSKRAGDQMIDFEKICGWKKKFRDKNFFDNRIIVGTNNDEISPNCGLGVRTQWSVMIRASVGYTTPRGTTPPISRWLAFSTFPFIHSPHSGSSQSSSSSLSLYCRLCLHSGRSGIHSLVILPACMFDFSS